MEESKIIIKFLDDYEVQDEHRGTPDATVYKKGLRKTFPATSARHFIDRGAAAFVKKAKG